MRTTGLRSFAGMLACLPLLAAGGCKWTDFDDLNSAAHGIFPGGGVAAS